MSVPAGVATKPHLHPKRTDRLQFVPMALWSAAVLLAIAATILLADDHRHLRSLMRLVIGPPQSSSTEPSMARPTEALEISPRSTPLLTMPLDKTKPLERLQRAEDRCKSLTLTDQEPPLYMESNSFSQCMLLYRDGESHGAPSVFIQVQTDQTGMVSSFRLKFNTEGKRTPTLAPKGLKILQIFGGFYLNTEEFISELSNRIDAWKNFQTVAGPYLIEMTQEVLDPNRFNVVGRLHRPATSLNDLWREEQGGVFSD